MPASEDVMNTLTAQWYNAQATALNVSKADFQIAQGTVVVPLSSKGLWDMMNRVPTDSIAQFYTPSINTFSGQYQTVMAHVHVSGVPVFETAMGSDNMKAWQAAWAGNVKANQTAIFAAMPGSWTAAQLIYFDEWSTINLGPTQGAQCASALAAVHDDPIFIGQQLLQINLPAGAEVPFDVGEKRMLKYLSDGTGGNVDLSSSTTSSDTTGAWSSSFQSAGGTYFYTKSSSSESSDFSQTFASSDVSVKGTYGKTANIPINWLSTGTLTDGGETFQPWFYGAALSTAYNNKGADTWIDPTKWDTFFGPSGSFQFAATALIIVETINQTITSAASYTDDQQHYAHSQSNNDYGCWPYYVQNDSSSTQQSDPSFADQSHMSITVTSSPGQPLLAGVLVSSMKALVTGALAE